MEYFLNRLEPKLNESIMSFIYRTTFANYQNFNTIFDDLSSIVFVYNCNYLDKGAYWYDQFSKVVNLLRRECDDLLLNKFDEYFSQDLLFGINHDRICYLKKHTKYCPECLNEDFYHRLYWDVSFVTVCTKHKILLLETCPRCSKKIRLARLMQNQCTCGYIYESAILPKTNLTDNEVQAQNILQGLLLNRKNHCSIKNGTKLDKKEYLRLFLLFCHLIDNVKVGNVYQEEGTIQKFNIGVKNKEPKNIEMMSLVTTFVHLLITNPEEYLLNVLNEINNQASFKKETRKLKMRSFNLIKTHEKGQLYNTIYNDYLIHLKDKYVNTLKNVEIKPEEKEYLTLEEVTKVYKIPLRRIKFLIDKGRLKLIKTNTSTGQVRLIEKSSIVTYLNSLKYEINKIDTSKLLGLQPERVIDMVERGILEAIHGPKTDGFWSWIFDEREVEKLLRKSLKNAQLIESPTEDMIHFHKANFLLRHLEVDTIDLFIRIVKGEFTAFVIKNNSNFSDVYLSKEEIENLKKQFEETRIAEKGYTLKEFGVLFNTDARKIKSWVVSGKIKSINQMKNPNGTTTYFIQKEYVENLVRIFREYPSQNLKKQLEELYRERNI